LGKTSKTIFQEGRGGKVGCRLHLLLNGLVRVKLLHISDEILDNIKTAATIVENPQDKTTHWT